MKKKLHSPYAMIVSMICFCVLAICYSYGAHKGLNARITAGCELDATSMGIALSRLWFHLHEGYIGYQHVYNALLHVLAPDANANNVTNFHLLSDPSTIQHAFDSVKKIIPSSLPSYSLLWPEFNIVLMEDLGLSDFYTLSFLIFGVHPTSMYNLYFLLFATSILLFIIEYRRQYIPLTIIMLITSLFPIFFFSDFFDISLPSVNANRFMSTLGFVPITYILCAYFSKNTPLTRMQLGRLVWQALLFAFALSIRRSAEWQLVGLNLFALSIIIKLYWPHRHTLLQLEQLRLLKQPALASILIFLSVGYAYQAIQHRMINPIYLTDSATKGHAVWHSAYRGLALHPDWAMLNPSKTATTDTNDGVAFNPSVYYMQERGINPISPLTGSYLFGMHELIIKEQFFNFIKKHKMFTLELYSYYKPIATINTLLLRLHKIDWYCIIYCILMSIISGFLLATDTRSNQHNIQPAKLLTVAALFLFTSFMPGMFAYPISYYADDLWMFAIFSSLAVCMLTYTLIVSLQ